MSEPDYVEITRQIYTEWGRGNFRAGAERYGDQTVLVMPPEFPEAGTYRGLEGIRGYMRDFLGAWELVVIEGTSFLAAGDSVVVDVNQRATGRGSGVPVELRYFHVWTFRGDMIVSIETFQDRSDALEAVGLRE